MSFTHTKTCVLCPNKIAAQYKLCNTCYYDNKYVVYMETPWFKELEIMQSKQDAIDKIEYMELKEYVSPKNIYTIKKNPWRPTTSTVIQQKVLDIFDTLKEHGEDITVAKIARIIQNKITEPTIAKILKTYRKDQFIPNKLGRPKKSKIS